MPSSKEGRLLETMCPVCEDLVGVWRDTFGTGAYKITRHHDGSRAWCAGSGYAVPAGAVIPTR